MKTLSTLLFALLTLAANAQLLTERVYQPSTNTRATPYDLIAANDGGYFVTGTAKDTGDNDAMFLLKVDANLDSVWSKTYHNANHLDMRGDVMLYNSSGNLCVLGMTFGPGVFVSLWELDQNGDTIQTRNTIIGSSGIDFVIPDAVARPDGGYVLTVRNNSTSSSIYSFDSDMNISWKWPSGIDYQGISPNAQFTGIELKDTTLYFAGRKVNGENHGTFFHARGLSGTVISTDTFGGHLQQMRAEDLVLTDNDEALLIGTMTTELNPGLYGSRIMILRTNLQGDSLGITNYTSHDFIENADMINGTVMVNCKTNNTSGVSNISLAYLDQNGTYSGEQDLTFGGTSSYTVDKVLRTLDMGDGNFVSLGKEGDNWNHQVYLVKYTPSPIGIGKIPTTPALTLYPNPTTDVLHVLGSLESANVQAVDALGRVWTLPSRMISTGLDLATDQLPRGVYMLIQHNNYIGRFVKQ